MHCRRIRLLMMLMAAVLLPAVWSPAADQLSGLRKTLAAASPSVKDITATMVVTSINKGNAGEINPAFAQIGQLQNAKIYYKRPDKFRADGVAKGMAMAYALNGGNRQIVIPGFLKRSEDVSSQAGKQTTTLDLGFVTDSIWKYDNVTLVGRDGGALKLKLDPKKDHSRRYEMIWVDPHSGKLLRRLRYNSEGKLTAKYVYADFKSFGKLPVAQRAKVYAPDGGFVGSVEYRDMKVNTGLSESLFVLVK